MKKVLNKLLDWYLKNPILLDIVFVVFIYFILSNIRSILGAWHISEALIKDMSLCASKESLGDIFSSLIGTCISLAGFILAALTIIVTFRSNIKAKGLHDASNALEFILSGKYYNSIVQVYTQAIIEFIIIAITLYFFWLFADIFNSNCRLTKIAFCSIFCVTTSSARSLWVLFWILNSEFIHRR
ncbi:hypothetical protein QNI16_07325 [Cytophagaceae bacterium YF14B1]|uniref:Uncharacterized protein n=1 Tax=Xanthocytophaga flava TaxID=3048013 RepID=A0AAE3QMR6_9BACT|nr:hypothetical protein [Xanthocytophaga flavus]MDJ1480290.1 hypothetical protein [Xanthocytophaga flavus]